MLFRSSGPSSSPSTAPSSSPSSQPSSAPSSGPSSQPSDGPSTSPSGSPSLSAQPSSSPSSKLSLSSAPSSDPSSEASTGPSISPSVTPSLSAQPSSSPSSEPSVSSVPSSGPSSEPSAGPSNSPSGAQSQAPSYLPSRAPTTKTRETLEEAILKDMMPLSSSQCQSPPSGQTSSTFAFASSQVESKWYEPYVDLEQHVFLAKMTHTDANENRTWTIRLGKAGNIYSFVGPMGETVPPQKHNQAPWIDEVWQSVSVDLRQNDPANGKAYFIHEAGTYQRDAGYVGVPLTDIPFYSPSLGKYCDDESGECSFMSWVSFRRNVSYLE